MNQPQRKVDEQPAAQSGVVLTPHIGEQVIYNLMNAQVKDYPFPHFVVENIWPDDFFDQLLAHLPSKEVYRGIMASGRLVNPNAPKETRYLFSMEEDIQKLEGEQFAFWHSVGEFLLGEAFHMAVMQKFLPYLKMRFSQHHITDVRAKAAVELFKDMTDYHIGPHSDTTHRLLNLFFYLPEDDSKPHLGTSFYVPKDKSIPYASGPHYEFEDFHRVFTAPYKRNVMAGFFKNNISYHGVEPVKEQSFERNALAYILRAYDTNGAPLKF